MFKIGEKVIYKKDLCSVRKIKENCYLEKDYYVLVSERDPSLTIEVPTDIKELYLRKIVSKEEAEKIIDSILEVDPIKVDEKNPELEYRALLNDQSHENLIKIIKTSYLRNQKRKLAGKKITDKDQNYLEKAELYLYNELAASLEISFDECKNYIISKLDSKNGEKYEESNTR